MPTINQSTEVNSQQIEMPFYVCCINCQLRLLVDEAERGQYNETYYCRPCYELIHPLCNGCNERGNTVCYDVLRYLDETGRRRSWTTVCRTCYNDRTTVCQVCNNRYLENQYLPEMDSDDENGLNSVCPNCIANSNNCYRCERR